MTTQTGVAGEDAAKDQAPPEQELLSWRVHPAASSRGKAVFVASAIVGLTVASAAYGGTALGIMALLLLGGSLWPFFQPTTYRLTSWGVEQRRWPTRQRRPWSAFRRFHVDRRGVLLSPFATPSRLDSFRGMYLLTDAHVDVEPVLRSVLRSDSETA